MVTCFLFKGLFSYVKKNQKFKLTVVEKEEKMNKSCKGDSKLQVSPTLFLKNVIIKSSFLC